ncbi:hypothetical protein L2E82_35691 [Cichorium intybus]|uniref:Uncharacterized protein n=1 Tax=Cichorium intybus TaxID=13427 RepID=A0ACB9BPM4_CICIN|nr:hypothetical protein L2E82_35691 [Cichorium intybus]
MLREASSTVVHLVLVMKSTILASKPQVTPYCNPRNSIAKPWTLESDCGLEVRHAYTYGGPSADQKGPQVAVPVSSKGLQGEGPESRLFAPAPSGISAKASRVKGRKKKSKGEREEGSQAGLNLISGGRHLRREKQTMMRVHVAARLHYWTGNHQRSRIWFGQGRRHHRRRVVVRLASPDWCVEHVFTIARSRGVAVWRASSEAMVVPETCENSACETGHGVNKVFSRLHLLEL